MSPLGPKSCNMWDGVLAPLPGYQQCYSRHNHPSHNHVCKMSIFIIALIINSIIMLKSSPSFCCYLCMGEPSNVEPGQKLLKNMFEFNDLIFISFDHILD